MKKTTVVFAVSAAFCLVASLADAATVTVSLVLDPAAPACNGCTLSGPGRYNLFAQASLDDNQGIAGYGISVQNVTSALHRAPRVNSVENSEGDINPAGFTLLRSANNAVALGTGFLIGAGQDTVTPTPYIVNGFGQTPSSWANELPPGTTNGGIIQPSWDGKLLLAEGSYDPGSLPFLDPQNVDVFVNVFAEGGVRPAILVFGGDVNEQPAVGDLEVEYFSVHPATIVTETLPLVDDDPTGGLWSLDSFTSPNGQPASVDPVTGQFTWLGNGSPEGRYEAVLKFTDAGGLMDTGTLGITWHIPEPSSLVLFGLALVGFAGFRRKQ